MKITICGSIAFIDKMVEIKKELETFGHEVCIPPQERINGDGATITSKEYYTIRHMAGPEEAWVWDVKEKAILEHFEKVAWSDAILVVNYDKNAIPGYIGANTLIEMGLALYLKKRIYLLFQIPELSYTEEIRGMKPIVLDGRLDQNVF